jgi:archaellum component FlaC
MHVMVRETWTDGRLDEFGKRMDERFDPVDERFNDIDRRFEEIDVKFEQVDKRFEQVDKRLDRMADGQEAGFARIDSQLDSIRQAIVFGAIACSSTVTGGLIAIATQV